MSSARKEPGRGFHAPSALHAIPGWLVWRYELCGGDLKPRKIPYYINGCRRHGRQGGEQDRAELVTYDMAIAALVKGGYDGIGFAPLSGFHVVALDFDNCVVDGCVATEVLAVSCRSVHVSAVCAASWSDALIASSTAFRLEIASSSMVPC